VSDGWLVTGLEGGCVTPRLTLTGPAVAIGSGFLLMIAWNVTTHDPAGNVVAPVQVPSSWPPELNHRATVLPATVAVTPLAALLPE
jgi:hypothetical protein